MPLPGFLNPELFYTTPIRITKSLTREVNYMSRRIIAFTALTSLLVLALALPFSTGASQPKVVGPVDFSGELHGAPYRIRVPAVWNGTLLLFAHGYRDKADHPGEIDNRNADVAPNAALEAPLLAQGFALAGSAYRDNGWAVEEGIQDMKDLTVLFNSLVGNPDRTILVGASLGTIITFESMERFGGIYDGALCLCAARRRRYSYLGLWRRPLSGL